MATPVSGQWGYSVPLEDTNGDVRATTSRTNSHEIRTVSRQNSAWDLQSDSEAVKTRKVSNRAVHAGASRKRSRNALRDSTKRDRSEKREENVDDSAWIHRDKLAQIEIREMEEAGFPVRHSQRSMSTGQASEYDRHARTTSRSEAGPPTSQDRPYDEVFDDEPTGGYGEQERKRISTIPAANEEEVDEQAVDFGDRAYDEPFAAPTPNGGAYHVVRPSASRIPISAKSPVPVSPEAVGRDSLLPHSRGGSSAHTNNWDELHNRARSGSMSSQVLPDEAEADGTRRTPPGSAKQGLAAGQSSPPKTRTPQKAAPGARKTSGTVARPGSSQGNREKVGRPSTATGKRPGSSQGHQTQASVGYTWNPDEADAPWITSMYKPDPRLPPDQQILPTHRKKMMQEQWEREGKTGTAYDSQFGLLNDHEFAKPPSPVKAAAHDSMGLELHDFPQPSDAAEHQSPTSPTDHYPASPTSPHEVKSENGSVRPETSGGYRITPSIAQTPNMYRSPLQSPQPMSPNITHTPQPHVPVMDEKEEEEPKGGCCCVMM